MILARYFLQGALSAAAYLVIAAGWWRFVQSRPAAAGYGPGFRILLTATLMWAQIFCTITALGYAGILYRPVGLGLNAGMTGCLLWFGRKAAPGTSGFVRLMADWVRRLGHKWRNALAPLGIVAALTFAWFTVINITIPTGGYDDYAFHVPGAATFVQTHSIATFETGPLQSAIDTAPKLSEIYCVWQFFITGDDRLVCFWALGLLLLYIAAVYGLCRELGANAALFGSVLSAFAPVLLWQTSTAHNDLPTCAFLATALRFAVAAQRGLLQRAALALSTGLLLSSKLSGALLSALVLAVFCLAERIRERRTGWLAIARTAIAIGAIAFAMGGRYYIENLRRFGNPFYPFEVKVAGLNLPGSISHALELKLLNGEFAKLPMPVRLWRLWREEKSHYGLWLYNMDSAYAGFGPILLVLGLPSLAAAFGLMLLERRWLAAAVLFAIAGAYLSFSGNITPRLSQFILVGTGLGTALVIHALDEGALGRVFPLTVRWLGLVLATYTFLVAAMSPISGEVIRNQLFVTPREKDMVAGTFLNAFVKVRTAIPHGARVAYDRSTIFLWPLWRPNWDNQVLFIAATEGWERWRARAAELGITHVAIGNSGKSPLSDWVRQESGHFRQVGAAGSTETLYAYTP